MKGNTKIGDVFVVNVSNSEKKYFQYIISDITQLNSDVIRVFKKKYSLDFNPSLLEIVTNEIEFYAHCVTKLGLKSGSWNYVGNIQFLGDTNHILFRDSEDYGKIPTTKISQKWWVWKVNNEQHYVGKLEGENQKAEIGLVINPESIVYRMVHGVYDLWHYPSY